MRQDIDGAAREIGAGVRDLRSVGWGIDLRDVVVIKARRDQQKQRTREARRDAVDLAFVDDLRVFAVDLRAPRLSVFRGAKRKTLECALISNRPEPFGTVIFAHSTPSVTVIAPEGNVSSTT